MDRPPLSPYDFFGYLAAGFVMIVSADRAFLAGTVLTHDYHALALIVLGLLAYTIGQTIATPAASILEDLIANRLIGTPASFLLGTRPATGWRRFLFPAYTRPLPKAIADRVNSFLDGHGLEHDQQTLVLYGGLSLRATKPQLAQRLDNFLNLYGFSRNIAFSLLLSTVILVVGHPVTDRVVATVDLALGATMFYRYLMFYRLYAQEVCAHLAVDTETLQHAA
jgi:hypothetical protein